MRVFVICNPKAGNGLAIKAGEMVKGALASRGIYYEFALTEAPGHATVLARAAAEMGFDAVLAVGGDGTASESAIGLYGFPTALGIVPAGTGNDFIKTIGTPKDPEEALEFILSNQPRATDAGEINGKLFLNEVGTGFDVMVLDYALKAKKYVRGILPYLYGVIMTIFKFKSIKLTYSLDGGEVRTEDILVCGVANGGVIGGGIPIAPQASADDGLLDMVIVKAVSKWRMCCYLPRLLMGKILDFKDTVFLRVRSMYFAAEDMRVNIDGEVVPQARADIRVLPGALMIYR